MSERMKWTKDAPTEPGWYWHRQGNRKKPSMVMVRIVSDPRPMRWETGAEYHNRFALRRDWKPVHKDRVHRWAGPIPEPEEDA